MDYKSTLHDLYYNPESAASFGSAVSLLQEARKKKGWKK